MKKALEILGIIPARAGSKGIKKKNIQKLNDEPLLKYSIEHALKSNISRVFVSTEDPKIASIAKILGADVPFLRPKKLAGDTTTAYSVIKNTISYFKKRSYNPDIIVIIQPTNPFRPKDMINNSIKLLKKKKATSILAVRPVEDHPDIIFKKGKKFIIPLSKDFLKRSNRQSRTSLLIPSGLIYTFWTRNIEKYGNQYGPKIYPYIIEDKSVNIDIDIPFDFFMAEMTIKYWKKFQNRWKSDL